MKIPPIVSSEAWEATRLEMLVKEKAFTRARDSLAAEVGGCPGCESRRRINSRDRRAR
jgi:predicted dithiol-disulfide oxidoreductase (DUF899 family)